MTINYPKQIRGLALLVAAFLPALASLYAPASLLAQSSAKATSQKSFGSPEDATKALLEAAKSGDKTTLHEIFGPDAHEFLTGDAVQDKANFEGFSRAIAAGCMPVREGTDKVILNIGTNNWPFPIPLVKQGNNWVFDTDAGREEIINRHIGRDELNAIGVCRAYVEAQNKYFNKDHDGSGVRKYALKFKSTAGKQDGLYWKSDDNSSPLSALVAEAHAEGYGNNQQPGPHPFHGYFFRILTAQGNAALGGKSDYLVNGNLTGGFALVAYPDRWGKSGIMTFIINQDGKVYQRNLGERTAKVAAAMNQYNPDKHWTMVTDLGVSEP